MKSTIASFIEKHIDLLDKEDFAEFYAISPDDFYRGELTDVLYAAGIDPLKYLDYVPKHFLNTSTIKSFTVPTHVLEAEYEAFVWSNLENIELHKDFVLSDFCFTLSKKLTNIVIPEIMNEVPASCFHLCTSLQQVDLAQVEQIREMAFAGCISLTEIFIPDCVEYIGDDSFENCSTTLTFVVHRDNEYAINYAKEHNIKVKLI